MYFSLGDLSGFVIFTGEDPEIVVQSVEIFWWNQHLWGAWVDVTIFHRSDLLQCKYHAMSSDCWAINVMKYSCAGCLGWFQNEEIVISTNYRACISKNVFPFYLCMTRKHRCCYGIIHDFVFCPWKFVFEKSLTLWSNKETSL